MHAPALEGGGDQILQPRLQVVGVQHRVARDLGEAVGPMALHIGQRPHEHAHLAVEGAEPPKGLGRLARGLFLQPPAPGAAHEARQGREGRQRLGKHHRPRARPAAAMGRGEGLVQIDVHGVDAELARPHPPDDGVEIGPVAVEERPRRMGQARDLKHVAFEQAAGVGIGDHHRRHVRAEPGLQVLEVHPAIAGLADLLHLIARLGGGGGIGAVGRDGREDAAADIAPRRVRRPHGQDPAELALGAGLGAERDGRHAGQGHQPIRQFAHQLDGALNCGDRLQRMEVGEAREPRQLLVQARVVLHRARAQRIERQVDGVILLRQPHVVAQGLRLRQPRQGHGRIADQGAEVRGVEIGRRHVDAGLLPASQLEDQRLFLEQGMTGCRSRSRLRPGGAADGHRVHASTLVRAPASAWMSSGVVSSVAAISRMSSMSASGCRRETGTPASTPSAARVSTSGAAETGRRTASSLKKRGVSTSTPPTLSNADFSLRAA